MSGSKTEEQTLVGSMFVKLDVRDFDFSLSPIEIPLFRPTNRDETTSQVSRLPLIYCFCADLSQLSQALSFIKSGGLLLRFVELDCPN